MNREQGPKYEAHMMIAYADGRTETRMLTRMKAQTFEQAKASAEHWAQQKLGESGGRTCMVSVYEKGRGQAFVLGRA